jgi:hypothetical protein
LACWLDGTRTLGLWLEVQIRTAGISPVLVGKVAMPMMRNVMMMPPVMPMPVMTVASPMMSAMATVTDLCNPSAKGLCETYGDSEVRSRHGPGGGGIQPHA